MKKHLRAISFTVAIFLLSLCGSTFAEDPPPPPPPGGGHGSTGNQGPMGAPAGNGALVFLAFAAGLAAWEFYLARKRKKPEHAD